MFMYGVSLFCANVTAERLIKVLLLINMMQSNKTNINKLVSECSVITLKYQQSSPCIYTDTFKHLF